MRNFWESIYCPNCITGYNPFLLRHMNEAIEKLVYAVNNRKKIVVYGTSSVDAICSIASLSLILRYLNADVEYLIHEGGEARKSVDCDDIKNGVDFLGADLLITLGLDLKSQKEEKLCNDLNIDLIVIENKRTVRERNYVYINPKQKGCKYRYKNLSLSALTFKLMQAISIYYNMKNVNKYLDLILIGAKWADVSPRGENAVFFKEGMKFLKNTNNNGLKAVMNLDEFNDKDIDNIIELITPTRSTVGVVNNARIVLELLTTGDKDRAVQIAKYLNKLKCPVI
ncbi:DHH family phosphoesterase [uncultured Clostridium sp.]|uniref:DHH family phosphoesterase n=1 Tax=uncultured Clostridium sp. TaxID=59620 RepID=UPI0025E68698|nr:DHH family phosphoesterase [uncultured Clostridium sp.]